MKRLIDEGLGQLAGHVRSIVARPGLRAQYVLDRFLRVAKESQATGSFLEIGCSTGKHTEYVRSQRVFDTVSCIDLDGVHNIPSHVTGSYESQVYDAPFDAIWTSHVLEHVRNPGAFLDKLHSDLSEGGVLAINVPPLKHAITVGHVTLWNPGVLLLNLIKSGFDCSEVSIRRQGYNIGLILRKKSMPIDGLDTFSPGVPESFRPYLPKGLSWFQNKRTGVWYFRGSIASLNWE